ncbi:protein kinase domain-containing protein [Tardiphaga sp. 841_E9_N1_2]|uniref:protein kinase domain-containing protein n=1 Tax=Tardiphaga sp. 841_E9_N1_2 TaxID=3240762 RepID=UPI003F217993
MDLALTKQIAAHLQSTMPGWRDVRFIDAGNSGAVFHLLHPEHGVVALKIYDPAFFQGDNALIEEKRVRLQEELRGHGNPYLIDIFEVGKIPEHGTWFLIMEMCPWPNLEKCAPDIPDSNVEDLLRQLVEGVQFLHTRGLVHRDIKPANIVVDPAYQHLKLLDLGVLRQIAHTEGNGTDQEEQRRFVARYHRLSFYSIEFWWQIARVLKASMK